MASVIQKFIKGTPPQSLRIIVTTTIRKTPHLPNPHSSKSDFTNNLVLGLNPTGTEIAEPTKPWQLYHYYPSFPFGYFLNPIATAGFDQTLPVEDDARTVWADSVKKKRKRKMNKHKYKKLRKRLRRKTS